MPSLKLTNPPKIYRTFQRKLHLPTINFQGFWLVSGGVTQAMVHLVFTVNFPPEITGWRTSNRWMGDFFCRCHQESAGESGSNVQSQAGLGTDRVTDEIIFFFVRSVGLIGCLGWLLRWLWWLLLSYLTCCYCNAYHISLSFFGGLLLKYCPWFSWDDEVARL